MHRFVVVVWLAVAATACGGGGSTASSGPSATSKAAKSPSTPPPVVVANGQAHGAAYSLLFGRSGGGFCLTLKLETPKPKTQELCGLSPSSPDGLGFATVDDGTKDGLLFGILPDIATGGVLRFDDGTDMFPVPALPPLDKTFPITVVARPTPGSLHGKGFTYVVLDAKGIPLVRDPARAPALTEEGLRQLKPA